jgi:hypothetical protein
MRGAVRVATNWAIPALAAAQLHAAALPAAAAPPVIGPEQRIDVGGGVFAANETSAIANDANPLEIVAGWNDWRRSPTISSELINSGFALSLDGGQTWTDFLVRPPASNQSSVEGDPMTAMDRRTGTMWVGAVSFTGAGGIYVARKDAGSSTFAPATMAHAGGSDDKPWMVAGPRPGLPNTTRLYIAFNLGVIWSDNLGASWSSPPVTLGTGLGFLPRIGPGGELYIAYWDSASGMKLKRSLNGGSSFTTHTIATRMDVWGTQDGSRFPGTFRVPSLVYIDVDSTTGTLYAVYFDTTSIINGQRNVDLYFCKSTDQGTTWTIPVIINGEAGSPPGDQFFPWIEVDDYGRIHIVYLDSSHTAQNDNVTDGMFDAYYLYSDDGGATWKDERLTAASWNSNNDGLNRPNQFIGDYLGLAAACNSVYPVYIATTASDTNIYTRKITFTRSPDLDGGGTVDISDLLDLLAQWGPCPAGPAPCTGDINGDCAVDIADLLDVLAAWTP